MYNVNYNANEQINGVENGVNGGLSGEDNTAVVLKVLAENPKITQPKLAVKIGISACTDIVSEWLQAAFDDYDSAKYLFDRPNKKALEIICYHCQQSAEKCLKGLLVLKTKLRLRLMIYRC